jgi:hypothetical protein
MRTPQMMNSVECAKFLGIDVQTLRVWNRRNEGPPRVRKGKRYYYSLEVAKEWLKAQGVCGGVPRVAVPVGEPVRSLSAASSFPRTDQPRRFR